MRTIITSILTLAVAFMSVAQIDVISAKEAASFINDDNAIFVSLRKTADFQKVHITGAVNINHTDLYGEMSMLKTPSEIAKVLGLNGISESKKIILYDDGSGRYSGRMYWILSYLGAKDVKIIDGGMKGWRMARKPVTKNPTNIDPTTFKPMINKSYLATMDDVKKGLNNSSVVLVDVRSPEEYQGTAETKLRPGHIPNAINLNYTNVLNERGMIKSSDDLKTLFADNGISKDKTIVVYCQTSVRAGIVFTALKGLGYSNIKVYDGAYLEWQSLNSNEVVM